MAEPPSHASMVLCKRTRFSLDVIAIYSTIPLRNVKDVLGRYNLYHMRFCATVFALLDSGRGGVGVYNRLRLKVSATSHMIGL